MKELHLPNLHESAVTAADLPALAEAGIELIGFTRITEPCRRNPVVDDSSYAHLHITLIGSAAAKIAGRMTPFPANHAYFVPPGAGPWEWLTDASPEDPWEVVFVRLSGAGKSDRFHFQDEPCILSDCGPLDLLWAYQRLHREALQPGRPVIVANLVDMIAYHVREVLSLEYKPPVLIELWSKVAANPDRSWDLDGMAKFAGMSKESLRQACLQETGRSPVRHVTHLRMRHAATLMQSGRYRVEDAARLVGYENPFNFSTAFKRAHGISPKQYQYSGRASAGQPKP
jgi:AraC-like DNA-binding protein